MQEDKVRNFVYEEKVLNIYFYKRRCLVLKVDSWTLIDLACVDYW